MRNFEAWSVDKGTYSPTMSDEEKNRFLIRYALLAASTHNTQPWQFAIDQNSIVVSEDDSRRLRVFDPDNRSLHISLGCAVANIIAAASYFGLKASIESIHGDPTQIRIEIAEASHHRENLARLLPMIPKRHTNRLKRLPKPLDPKVLNEIKDLVREQNQQIHAANQDQEKESLADLSEEATKYVFERSAYREEISKWIRINTTNKMDGMPAYVKGVGTIPSFVAKYIIRYLGVGPSHHRKSREVILSSPTLLVLGTREDSKEAWVRFGVTMQLIHLLCTLHDVKVAYFAGATELEHIRTKLSDFVGIPKPQMILSLGYVESEARPTPRRSLDEVLV